MVFVNNLPAASFLATWTPEHPFTLIAGLNLGLGALSLSGNM
jgi:hypothetical protein